jgi:DNA-binding response OmpR family regulator
MGAKILVVDDEPNIVDILKANLEREGYSVVTAGDGAQALDLGQSAKPTDSAGLHAPKWYGFDFCGGFVKPSVFHPDAHRQE